MKLVQFGAGNIGRSFIGQLFSRAGWEVVAENIHGAASTVRNNLKQVLAPSFPLEEFVGLVETSIGKMVPLMHSCDLAQDPLQLFAEEYETLILAKKGFIRQIPEPGNGWPESITLVDNISAYEYAHMLSGDERFHDLFEQEGISNILQKVSGLDPMNSLDARVIQQIVS
ncbi:MAG TPA: hypothetical protein PLG79_04270 [Spirochaetales bacterium]|nr:hypothetical protein [Spirochaetales bacterium]